jgi:hypothetical protein
MSHIVLFDICLWLHVYYWEKKFHAFNILFGIMFEHTKCIVLLILSM